MKSSNHTHLPDTAHHDDTLEGLLVFSIATLLVVGLVLLLTSDHEPPAAWHDARTITPTSHQA